MEEPERQNNEAESKIIMAILKDKAVIVSSSEDINELGQRGYGTKEDKKLKLPLVEALYLVSKAIIQVETAAAKKTSKPISFQQLLKEYRLLDQNAWAKYLIYRDLRSRGYVAREGFGLGIDFRVYERGGYGSTAAKYLVYGMQEGQPVKLEELARTLKHAQSQKKELVIAVLNRRGETVYYSLSTLNLK